MKILKSPAVFELMTNRFVEIPLTHCTTLLGNNFLEVSHTTLSKHIEQTYRSLWGLGRLQVRTMYAVELMNSRRKQNLYSRAK